MARTYLCNSLESVRFGTIFSLKDVVGLNKTETSKVGAIYKAQKAQFLKYE